MLALVWTACAVLTASSERVDLGMNPVTKVVALLEDMRDSLNSEAKTDEELYQKLSCWCETNGGNKKAAIATAEQRISTTAQSIEEFAGKIAELKATIARTEKEVAANKAGLEKAAGLRAKERTEFEASEQELLQSLGMVSNAVDALSKHHEFLQVGATHHLQLLAAKATDPSQRAQLRAFIEDKALPSAGSYSSRSGAIFGIMEQMKETFQTNLDQARQEEGAAKATFASLEQAKSDEIAEGRATVMAKTQEQAETDEALVHAKHDLKKTRAALSADQQFLLDLNKRCAEADSEYEERKQMRQEELVGVGEAITILTDDSARDTFSSTLSFVQVSASSAQQAAAKVLAAAAAKTGSKALAELASSAKLDAFTKVKAAIDEMVSALKQEQEEEFQHNDFCVKELRKNGQQQKEKQQKIKDLTLSLDDMASTIDTLTKNIAELEAQVAEAQRQVKHASEDREQENQEFQQTVADQRATQAILQKAYDRLGEVYNKKSFVQVRAVQEPGAAAPPPPSGFKDYKQQGQSGGVLALIQQIINEAKQLEKEALHAEQTAQASYEDFLADSSKSMASKQRTIAAKAGEKAELETASVAATGNRAGAMTDLENLSKYNGELHKSCDFVMNNFKARQTARAEEIDSLGQANAILSGASFS